MEPAAGGYTFLGDLVAHERTDSGVLLHCEPGAALAVRFLAADVVRVTLARPDRRESLLAAPLVEDGGEPVPFAFAEKEGGLALRSEDLEIIVEAAPCRLTIRDRQGTVISRDDPGLGIGWDGAEVRNWKTLGEDERFFGLGEKTGDVDKRGREWVMWNSDTPGYDDETDPLYLSVPFFLGRSEGKAYGIFFNNSHQTVFNLGAGNHRYYSFAAAGGALDYFLFYGPALPEIVTAYTELTGRMPMPPRWALGYHQSRWSYTPAAEVLRIARTFREKRIPADVLYLDIHHMDGYRVFTWHPERFPQPRETLDELAALDFKIVTIVDPGVKAEPGYRVAEEGLAGGHFVRYPDGEVYVGSVWPGRSYFPDFSRRETRAWWGGYLKRLLDQGVDGIWNDMNEPAVWGKAFPLEVMMGEGAGAASMKRMHNLYGFLMAEGSYEALRRHRPRERPFVLTRAGFAGIQRHAAAWTGDNVASWEHLALGIRMMIGLGLSGVPFVGTDVGGFEGHPSPELFARWIQVGAFSPFFRTHTAHGTPAQEPWSFGEPVEALSRAAIEQRYRLLPYLYSVFREAHTTGHPILRPLFWHFADDPAAYDRRWQHQFLLGESLMVVPVLAEGQRLVEAYLPAGEWLELGSGRIIEGPGTATIDAPLERLPLLLRAGGILPLQAPVPHTAAPPAGPLVIELFAAADGDLLLYEDDGLSPEYERGAYRSTRLACRRGEAGIAFTRTVEHDGFAVPARALELRFLAAGRPRQVTLDGEPLSPLSPGEAGEGFFHDAGDGVLTVRLRERGATQRVVVR